MEEQALRRRELQCTVHDIRALLLRQLVFGVFGLPFGRLLVLVAFVGHQTQGAGGLLLVPTMLIASVSFVLVVRLSNGSILLAISRSMWIQASPSRDPRPPGNSEVNGDGQVNFVHGDAPRAEAIRAHK